MLSRSLTRRILSLIYKKKEKRREERRRRGWTHNAAAVASRGGGGGAKVEAKALVSFLFLVTCACVCWASTQKNIRKRTTHLIVLLLLPSAAWREPYLFDYNMDRQVPVAGTYHSATLFMMCTHTHTTRTISSRRRRRRKVTRGCLSLF